ncbi:MAG TPA: hypothetical protein VFA18_00380, partial [Gemmataceae bacterium]|nr:hypothetical protein [Gemmataceae bacterium]
KSQKRNRRRLIIEQLILLLLRILLVLLAGLLLARLVGWAFAGSQSKRFVHVVLLDDRLSMTDAWKGDTGEKKNCFDLGKQRIEDEIAKPALRSRLPQRLVMYRLSDLQGLTDSSGTIAPDVESGHHKRFDERLTDSSMASLEKTLKDLDACTLRHLSLANGLNVVDQEVFKTAGPNDVLNLYIVSDFRETQWGQEDSEAIDKKLQELANRKVKIKMVDTAHPFRSKAQKVPLYHDNLAIMDLRPETAVAAEQTLVNFKVVLANYGTSEAKGVRVTIRVDGVERPEGSLTVMSIPAGKTDLEKSFQLGFNRPPDLPLDVPYFARVSASLENEPAGLQADNNRYAVVEIRKQVPVLLIDGDISNSEKPGGDLFHVRKLFTAARGFAVEVGGPRELEKGNLESYPSIYIMNVQQLSDQAVHNVEQYVRSGGGVAFFMGERVNGGWYNRKLYRKGEGVFPVPLADGPTPKLSEEDKQKRAREEDENPPMQLIIRNPDNRIFAEIYKARDILRLLHIDRHFPVPRTAWDPDKARTEHGTEVLATLPNDQPVAAYAGSVSDLLRDLPTTDPKYGTTLKEHADLINAAMQGSSVQAVADALRSLLDDKGKEKDPKHPSLPEFWGQNDPVVRNLAQRIAQLRDRILMGDPLVVSGHFGHGRTVTVLTTAGQGWTDWPGGSLATVTYPLFMIEMQKYLTSLDQGEDQAVGNPYVFTVDSARFQPRMKCYLPQDNRAGVAIKTDNNTPPWRSTWKDLGAQSGTLDKEGTTFRFAQGQEPGIYLFELSTRPDPMQEAKSDWRAVAYNVEPSKESDLRRAGKAELERFGNVYGMDTGEAVVEPDQRTDLSENPWFYLLFLAIL